MQAISNQKGAVQKSIRCHFSEKATQRVTLKDVFIKKSEQYIVNLSNFITNAGIPLFMEDEEKKDNRNTTDLENKNFSCAIPNYSLVNQRVIRNSLSL